MNAANRVIDSWIAELRLAPRRRRREKERADANPSGAGEGSGAPKLPDAAKRPGAPKRPGAAKRPGGGRRRVPRSGGYPSIPAVAMTAAGEA